MAAALKLSLVVPCYNEEAGLASLYQRCIAAATKAVGDDFELVLVNDGSRDSTWNTMVRLADLDRRVVAINLSRNYGHQLALSAGLSFVRGERVLVLDADLQDPPELLSEMMRLMDEGADVVYGQRISRKGESAFKRLSAIMFYRCLSALSEIPIPADTGDFRLMSRRAVDALNRMPERQRFIRGMVSWLGFEQRALPYVRDPRTSGKSNYPFRRMLRLALDAITGFSTRPLRLASVLGLMFALLGGLGIVITVAAWATNATLPGWASVMVVLLALGGIQLTVLGIIGEYVGRLYHESKQRPLFFVDQIYSMDASVNTGAV